MSNKIETKSKYLFLVTFGDYSIYVATDEYNFETVRWTAGHEKSNESPKKIEYINKVLIENKIYHNTSYPVDHTVYASI